MNGRDYETVAISDKNGLCARFLYNCLIGRILLKLLIRRTVSKFVGFVLNRRFTIIFIHGFIKRNNIKIEEFKDVKYKSFNDFFKREIKDGLRPFSDNVLDVAAPCDGKLTAYKITPDGTFHIKNSVYTTEGLLKCKTLADEFMGGLCLIFRLTPDDYHRYAYIDNGESISRKKIKGVLHTVRPIAQKRYKVFVQNTREYEVIQTENFGKVIQMEVGALFVGRIKNHNSEGSFARGDEKGMFEFGGSTIVMLFQKDTVNLYEAIIVNTLDNKETIVKMGQSIGRKPMQGGTLKAKFCVDNICRK